MYSPQIRYLQAVIPPYSSKLPAIYLRPQSRMEWIMSVRVFPLSVREYSVLGGTTG